MPLFEKRTQLEVSAGEAFRWHARPGALLRLTPPWERVEIVEARGGIEKGARVVIRTFLGPIPQRWVAEHTEFVEGRLFRDVQRSGPFRKWEHTHEMVPLAPDRCELVDRVDYLLPLGTGLLLGGWARRKLERLFEWRHALTAADLLAHRGVAPMGVRFEGAAGAFSEMLFAFLATGGHRLGPSGERAVRFEPDAAVAEGRRIALPPRPSPLERERSIGEIYAALRHAPAGYSLPPGLDRLLRDA